MSSTRKLWAVLALVTIVSFIVLSVPGREVYRQAPPIPEQVRAESGAVLFTAADVMQGLNTTPLHGHTALFGVYGMLGIGLAAMALMSLAPVGIMQVIAAVEHGFWFARSPEFLNSGVMQTLVWLRVPGDVVFSIGALLLALFVLRLFVPPRKRADLLQPDAAAHTPGS